MMGVYINRDDVITYVGRTLPHEDLSTIDVEAIADVVIAENPEVIGDHDLSDSTAIDRVSGYLDATLNEERYWQIVQENGQGE